MTLPVLSRGDEIDNLLAITKPYKCHTCGLPIDNQKEDIYQVEQSAGMYAKMKMDFHGLCYANTLQGSYGVQPTRVVPKMCDNIHLVEVQLSQ